MATGRIGAPVAPRRRMQAPKKANSKILSWASSSVQRDGADAGRTSGLRRQHFARIAANPCRHCHRVGVVGNLIGSGEAQERGIVGETPNLAARLQGIAESNRVAIAENKRKLLGYLFELDDLGARELKVPGRFGPGQRFAQVRWRTASRRSTRPALGLEVQSASGGTLSANWPTMLVDKTVDRPMRSRLQLSGPIECVTGVSVFLHILLPGR